MTCDELRPDYLPYALGVLEDPEKSELRAHLARRCERCLAGVREANDLAFALGTAVPQVDPSRGLRDRVLAAAGVAPPQPRWHWRTAWQVAAAMAVLSIAAILIQTNRKDADVAAVRRQLAGVGDELAAAREQLTRANLESASLRDAISLLQAPEVRQVQFGTGAPAPPKGRVFYDNSRVLLLASNLPAPPPGKTYEMWIIPKGGRPAPAGLFASTALGTAVHLHRLSAALSNTDTIAVTLEAAGGADQPTSQPLIVAPL